MNARVVRVLVKERDAVQPHQGLVVLEAMKMEHTIRASTAATVLRVHYREGTVAPAGAALVDLGPP
jgi:3-methylcrotonyl-CoA carboxylase alpha subunit